MSEMNAVFSGNIFIVHCFDVGDDIDLGKISAHRPLVRVPLTQPKYFKNYHVPIAVELPTTTITEAQSHLMSAKLHSFGAISLLYKIPFSTTFELLRSQLDSIDQQYRTQSATDAGALYKLIKSYIKQPRFFHLRNSYVIIQVDPQSQLTDVNQLKKEYGGVIASMVRFENESLSEHQKDEILESALGYYRGDLVVIDTEAAFVYDDEYEDLLYLIEFANLQHLEMQYFDRLLDNQLTTVYERREVRKLPLSAYLPFIGAVQNDPIGDLGTLKVDISVITERLANTIKLAGDVYYTEIYNLLSEKLDLDSWKESINYKLSIIQDITSVYQSKVDAVREDLLSVLVIVLIFIEVVIGLLNVFKK